MDVVTFLAALKKKIPTDFLKLVLHSFQPYYVANVAFWFIVELVVNSGHVNLFIFRALQST